jgi:pimeloyl-ACP methyl ester carboxylesterase
METIQLNGYPVQLLRGGQGPALLYLHSAAGEVDLFPFHEQLMKHFTLYAAAHPGFGGSEGLDRVDSIEDVVFHYTDLLDFLGLDRVKVVGVSLGGWIAAELATRNPERVSGLILCDAAGLYVPGFDGFEIFQDPLANPGFPTEMRRRCFHDPTSDVAMGFIRDMVPPDKILLALRARQATARVSWNPYFYNPKLRSRLYRVKCPSMVLWGDSDGLLPLDFARAYHESIPGSKLNVMEKCGHLPQIECPERFVAEVAEFFSHR